ncbi:ADP-ribosylglycohydrolase family protein [Alkaliphilus peptidifermentans]
MCGNILGACYGIDALPKEWIKVVQLKELIVDIGNKLFKLSDFAFNRR